MSWQRLTNTMKLSIYSDMEEFTTMLKVTGIEPLELINTIEEFSDDINFYDLYKFCITVGRTPLQGEIYIIKKFGLIIFLEYYNSGYRLKGVKKQ